MVVERKEGNQMQFVVKLMGRSNENKMETTSSFSRVHGSTKWWLNWRKNHFVLYQEKEQKRMEWNDQFCTSTRQINCVSSKIKQCLIKHRETTTNIWFFRFRFLFGFFFFTTCSSSWSFTTSSSWSSSSKCSWIS